MYTRFQGENEYAKNIPKFSTWEQQSSTCGLESSLPFRAVCMFHCRSNGAITMIFERRMLSACQLMKNRGLLSALEVKMQKLAPELEAQLPSELQAVRAFLEAQQQVKFLEGAE